MIGEKSMLISSNGNALPSVDVKGINIYVWRNAVSDLALKMQVCPEGYTLIMRQFDYLVASFFSHDVEIVYDKENERIQRVLLMFSDFYNHVIPAIAQNACRKPTPVPLDPGTPHPIGGGGGSITIIKNPCDEKKTIDNNMKDPAFSKPLNDLRDKLATSPNEWGVEQVLSSTDINRKWIQKTPYSDNNVDRIHSNFTWNAGDGYTIGFAHSHPSGSAPSPQDILDLVDKALTSPAFKLYPSDQNFFINNASITVVTKDNNYIITLNDWDKIKTLYESFKSDPVAFEENFLNQSNKLQYGLAGLLSIFGSAINIYVDPLDGGGVIPVKLDNNSKKPVATPC